MFCIPQRYDFSSKSQPSNPFSNSSSGCFVYRKGTIFQANHNTASQLISVTQVVLYTAKVRFFKQITTLSKSTSSGCSLFCIPQRYDFSSKSQPLSCFCRCAAGCFVYRKGTIFQANHNAVSSPVCLSSLFCIPQRYDFSSKSQLTN